MLGRMGDCANPVFAERTDELISYPAMLDVLVGPDTRPQ
jgi:hypothetical protein